MLFRATIFFVLLVSLPSFGHGDKDLEVPVRPPAAKVDVPDPKLCWEAKKVLGFENVRAMEEGALRSHPDAPAPLRVALTKMGNSLSQPPSAIVNRPMSAEEKLIFERWPLGYPEVLPGKSKKIGTHGDQCYRQTVDLWNEKCEKKFPGLPKSETDYKKLSEMKRHRLEDGDFGQNLGSMWTDPMDESTFESEIEHNPKSNEEEDPHWFYTYRYKHEAKFPQEIRDFRKKFDQVDAWYELVERGKIKIIGDKYKRRGSTKALTDLQKKRIAVTGEDDFKKDRNWLEYKISEITKLVQRLGASRSIVEWYREVDESDIWTLKMAEQNRLLGRCIQTDDNANMDEEFKNFHFVSCLRKKEPAWAICQFCSPDECWAAKNGLSSPYGQMVFNPPVK